ncbi:hypothetical protein L1987_66630 [Smallanthus sonchifolius]|uniref:Uncharacterized protein n=1 Tax=Smallanthus sonchifolius TaxID=185202 RepID=A0ACB9BXU4_9ASTR|nr:hypothetical protein L1987_66630 [Smallanthus sonchifolius]
MQTVTSLKSKLRGWGYEPIICSVETKTGLDSLQSKLSLFRSITNRRMNMDCDLQKKLDEFGAGFENILQESFLADKNSRKGKSIVGPATTELRDKADDNRYK